MLTFTQAQQDLVLNNRRSFNARQVALNESIVANSGGMIGNAFTLPRDVWGEWDREAVEIQREVLSVFDDLSSAVSTPMSIGKLIHYFQRMSDSGEVNVSLDGRSKARTDQPVLDYKGTPLPILDSSFSYGWRQMLAASTEGFQLDSGGRINAMHKVAVALEDIALTGNSKITVGSDGLYGITNHPKRNTRTTGVALNGATGAQWQTEIKATLKLLHDQNFRVPVTLYVNFDDWFYASNTDYKTESEKSIAQKVREIDGVQAVVPASKITAGTIVAVVKNRRSIQVLNGMPMSTRAQFRANPEDDYNFVTMAAAAVEVKYSYTDQCGIAHSSL